MWICAQSKGPQYADKLLTKHKVHTHNRVKNEIGQS